MNQEGGSNKSTGSIWAYIACIHAPLKRKKKAHLVVFPTCSFPFPTHHSPFPLTNNGFYKDDEENASWSNADVIRLEKLGLWIWRWPLFLISPAHFYDKRQSYDFSLQLCSIHWMGLKKEMHGTGLRLDNFRQVSEVFYRWNCHIKQF